jgi:mRNA-degrading endonuclease RelE of RelBE toxin-antitoxin system
MTIIQVMPAHQRFTLVYTPEVKQHLRAIEPKYFSLIHKVIEEKLHFEPDLVTRNRKPLRAPTFLDAEWELRFGPANRFRVFYQIDAENSEVWILAVGVKIRNRLYIGGEEIKP